MKECYIIFENIDIPNIKMFFKKYFKEDFTINMGVYTHSILDSYNIKF